MLLAIIYQKKFAKVIGLSKMRIVIICLFTEESYGPWAMSKEQCAEIREF